MNNYDVKYIISDDETIENIDTYYIIVRYQISSKEIEDRISNGGFVETNILLDIVNIHKIKGLIYTNSGKIIRNDNIRTILF